MRSFLRRVKFSIALLISKTAWIFCFCNITSKNADVNFKDEQGINALMIGCQKGEIEIVSILIANGSLINELDNNGNSALHHSLDNNSESKADIIRILAEKKCQINQLNEDHVSLQGVTFNEISEIERLEIGILAY